MLDKLHVIDIRPGETRQKASVSNLRIQVYFLLKHLTKYPE